MFVHLISEYFLICGHASDFAVCAGQFRQNKFAFRKDYIFLSTSQYLQSTYYLIWRKDAELYPFDGA